jgi:hypothetical protein
VDSECLVRTLRQFLAGSRDALVSEDGAIIFDLRDARYSVSGDHGRCLLHLWSGERNVVRRVVNAEVKPHVLELSVQRLGQTRPTKLEICCERDRRAPSVRKTARAAYEQRLRRILAKRFPDLSLVSLSSAMNLERSFGPIYARGLMRRGQSGFAVIGVNSQETQASIDASLTFGILWLDYCRQAQAGKVHVEGVKLFVPPRTSAVVAERMAHLNQEAARWQLYEVDERDEAVHEVDWADRGNLATRLVRCPDEQFARERFAEAIQRVQSLLPETEVAVLSPAEIAFRCRGLEFARARLGHECNSFRSRPEIVFGVGAEEVLLDDTNKEHFAACLKEVEQIRRADGSRGHTLFRLQSERWLESLVTRNLRAIDEQLEPDLLYSQVPAFSSSDRAMIDVLGVTRAGRLAVVELKADEDIHLPLQGLDYWSRVNWHHERGEFTAFGYFPGHGLSTERSLLFLVAPALRVHPATDTLLRYLGPAIEWTLVGIDERWRHGVRVVFRKRSQSQSGASAAILSQTG